jgi:hypothetical protein
MKNHKGFYIVGSAIIIASIIISTVIYTKQTSSLEDCYKKNYKSTLRYELKRQKELNEFNKKNNLKIYSYSIEDTKAEAAIQARRSCRI